MLSGSSSPPARPQFQPVSERGRDGLIVTDPGLSEGRALVAATAIFQRRAGREPMEAARHLEATTFGCTWLSISRAAKLLGTNAQGVRKLMGQRAVDWRQTRANSRTLVVDETRVMELRRERPALKLLRSPDPLARIVAFRTDTPATGELVGRPSSQNDAPQFP
jgi:hypothetical protein